MLKNLLIDIALAMAARRNRQAVAYSDKSDWWADLSEAIEDGVSISQVRNRRPESGAAR